MPRLADLTDADLKGGAFTCRSVPLAMRARQAHELEIQKLEEPWWRLLGDEYHDSSYMEEEMSESWKLF